MNRIILCALALATITTVQAQQADVTFFVIGKHASVRQDAAGELHPVDFSFFSEIFLTEGGDATRALLTLPNGTGVPFNDQREAAGGKRDNILLVSGSSRYTTNADLQADYPDGEYRISFESPSGSVGSGGLRFTGGALPVAPMIYLKQGGKDRCTHVDAAAELSVSWSRFTEGGADPNGILDDLIFVILTDDDGVRVAHSGRPFEGASFLTYADEGFTIPAGRMETGRRYVLSVEHAVLDDTRQYGGVPAMTTRAVTTKLDIETDMKNAAAMEVCRPGRRTPSISSQTVMFYYKELTAPADFYGNVLGLENTLDWNWVKMYKTSPAGTVGLVMEGEGAYHNAQGKNAVMLSLVTDEVDAWYERLKDREDIKFLKEIQDGGGIRSFLLEDPGGYTVEFFQWLSPQD